MAISIQYETHYYHIRWIYFRIYFHPSSEVDPKEIMQIWIMYSPLLQSRQVHLEWYEYNKIHDGQVRDNAITYGIFGDIFDKNECFTLVIEEKGKYFVCFVNVAASHVCNTKSWLKLEYEFECSHSTFCLIFRNSNLGIRSIRYEMCSFNFHSNYSSPTICYRRRKDGTWLDSSLSYCKRWSRHENKSRLHWLQWMSYILKY